MSWSDKENNIVLFSIIGDAPLNTDVVFYMNLFSANYANI